MRYVGYSYKQARTLFSPVMADILLTCSIANHLKNTAFSPVGGLFMFSRFVRDVNMFTEFVEQGSMLCNCVLCDEG